MLLLLWIDERKKTREKNLGKVRHIHWRMEKKLSRLFFKLQKIFYNQSAWKNERRERKKRAFICLLHRVTCAFLCNFLYFLLLSDSINSQELLFSYQLYCQHLNVYECVFLHFPLSFIFKITNSEWTCKKNFKWWNFGILFNENQ